MKKKILIILLAFGLYANGQKRVSSDSENVQNKFTDSIPVMTLKDVSIILEYLKKRMVAEDYFTVVDAITSVWNSAISREQNKQKPKISAK